MSPLRLVDTNIPHLHALVHGPHRRQHASSIRHSHAQVHVHSTQPAAQPAKLLAKPYLFHPYNRPLPSSSIPSTSTYPHVSVGSSSQTPSVLDPVPVSLPQPGPTPNPHRSATPSVFASPTSSSSSSFTSTKRRSLSPHKMVPPPLRRLGTPIPPPTPSTSQHNPQPPPHLYPLHHAPRPMPNQTIVTVTRGTAFPSPPRPLAPLPGPKASYRSRRPAPLALSVNTNLTSVEITRSYPTPALSTGCSSASSSFSPAFPSALSSSIGSASFSGWPTTRPVSVPRAGTKSSMDSLIGNVTGSPCSIKTPCVFTSEPTGIVVPLLGMPASAAVGSFSGSASGSGSGSSMGSGPKGKKTPSVRGWAPLGASTSADNLVQSPVDLRKEIRSFMTSGPTPLGNPDQLDFLLSSLTSPCPLRSSPANSSEVSLPSTCISVTAGSDSSGSRAGDVDVARIGGGYDPDDPFADTPTRPSGFKGKVRSVTGPVKSSVCMLSAGQAAHHQVENATRHETTSSTSRRVQVHTSAPDPFSAYKASSAPSTATVTATTTTRFNATRNQTPPSVSYFASLPDREPLLFDAIPPRVIRFNCISRFEDPLPVPEFDMDLKTDLVFGHTGVQSCSSKMDVDLDLEVEEQEQTQGDVRMDGGNEIIDFTPRKPSLAMMM